MTSPDRTRDPDAAGHAALVAELAQTLPLAAGLATILATMAGQPTAEPGQPDHARLVADLTDTLDLPAGAADILHTEGGYAALLADVSTTVDLATGLADILEPIAPDPARPDPATTPEPIAVGPSATASTGVIEPTVQANLEKIAAVGGAGRLLLRLNGRYRNLRAAIEAINDIRAYLTHPAINLAADPSLDEIPAKLIQHHDSLERIVAALANTLRSRRVVIYGDVGQTLIGGGRQVSGIAVRLMEAEEKEQIGDVEDAARLLGEAADRGDGGAMRNLARLLLKAAERGDAGAWAGRLEGSYDVTRLVDLAAQRGDAGAMQDLPRLLREAAEHGNAGALADVARLIDQAAGSGDAGFLVRVAAVWEQVGDLDAAVRLLGEAADRGDAGAVRELARLRADAGDLDAAVRLLGEAADRGDAGALADVARLRADAGDLDAAVRLLGEAADRGDADAIRALALLREERAGGDIDAQVKFGAASSADRTVWYAAKSSDPDDENAPAAEIAISGSLSSGEDLAVDTAAMWIPATETPGQRRDRHDGRFPASTVAQADAVLRQVAGSLQQLSEPGLIYRLSVAQREACRNSAASLALILDRISDALVNFNGADLRDADIHHGDLEDTDGAHWRDHTSGEEPTRWPATIESQIIEHSEAVPWAPGEFVVRFGARISTPG